MISGSAGGRLLLWSVRGRCGSIQFHLMLDNCTRKIEKPIAYNEIILECCIQTTVRCGVLALQ